MAFGKKQAGASRPSPVVSQGASKGASSAAANGVANGVASNPVANGAAPNQATPNQPAPNQVAPNQVAPNQVAQSVPKGAAVTAPSPTSGVASPPTSKATSGGTAPKATGGTAPPPTSRAGGTPNRATPIGGGIRLAEAEHNVAVADTTGYGSAAVPEEMQQRIQREVLEIIDPSHAANLNPEQMRSEVSAIIENILGADGVALSRTEQDNLTAKTISNMVGYGPIDPLLKDPTITDILVNGPNNVWGEIKGKMQKIAIKFRDEEHLLEICRRIANTMGRRIDESSPLLDARLPDGSRVHIAIKPVAYDGPYISIRKFASVPISLEQMVANGNLSEASAVLLDIAAKIRLNIIVSGGTGSGKTTLLNAISQRIQPSDRILTVEDTVELQLPQPHVVALEARPPNVEGEGEITIRELVKNALRMRPERIIIGEVRGGEVFDMLQAMNTGHDGSLATAHANNSREALIRIENMCLQSGFNLPTKVVRAQIAAAIDLIIQVERMRDGVRRVTEISEVAGIDEETIVTSNIMEYAYKGENEDGILEGDFLISANRPSFYEKAHYFGLADKLNEVLLSGT